MLSPDPSHAATSAAPFCLIPVCCEGAGRLVSVFSPKNRFYAPFHQGKQIYSKWESISAVLRRTCCVEINAQHKEGLPGRTGGFNQKYI